MKNLFLFLLCALIPTTLFAESQEGIPTSIHIHSDVSSGARPIREITDLAKKQNVRAIVMTDLLYEHYEYGIPPLQMILKKSFDRNSISKFGTENYFQAIKKASTENPDVLVVDGAAVTPFYYWSGNLFPGPVVLNGRGKDFLVLGLGKAQKYDAIPLTGKGNSGFDAYSGDQFSKPYQQVIDQVQKEGGLVFWSHPHASEHSEFDAFLGMKVVIDTPVYEDSLLNTFRYDGFGVYSSDLSMIHTSGHVFAVSPENIWDRVLTEYCEGKRKEPAWIIGEVDYNGMPAGIRDLDQILTMVLAPEASREALLQAMKTGKSYVIIPASHTERLLLDEFSVSERDKAGMGETLFLNGAPTIKIQTHYSEVSKGTLQILLIKDGKVIQQWTKEAPFDIEYQDTSNSGSGKSYYRVIIYSDDSPHRLLTNPIFTERK